MANRASGRSVTLSQKVSYANRWRNSYNPLRSLTLVRAVSLLEDIYEGRFTDVEWTWYFIEQTDPDLLALVERRTSAIGELDWNIKVVAKDKRRPDFSEQLAADQAGYLRACYDNIENLGAAIEHLEMASFRMFSMLQPQIAGGGGDPIASIYGADTFAVLDQWNFLRDGLYGRWFWNPDARMVSPSSMQDSDAVDMESVIVRLRERPIDRFALVKFVRSNLSEKDWDAFVEIYGLAQPIIIMPPDIPPGEETQYQTVAEEVSEAASGALPNGSDVKYPSEMRGMQPFKARLDHLSEKLVLAGTGGRLTMLTAPGSGTLAGNAHTETFKSIAAHSALQISEVFQKQFDKRLLAARFPGRPVLAYFELAAREERDVGDIIEHNSKLALAGSPIEISELSEKTGYKLVDRRDRTNLFPGGGVPGAGQTQPATSFPPSARDLLNRSARALLRNRSAGEVMNELVKQTNVAKAAAEDLKPFADKAAAVAAIEDPAERRAAAIALREVLRKEFARLMKDSELARLLEESMTAAALNGVVERQSELSQKGAGA